MPLDAVSATGTPTLESQDQQVACTMNFVAQPNSVFTSIKPQPQPQQQQQQQQAQLQIHCYQQQQRQAQIQSRPQPQHYQSSLRQQQQHQQQQQQHQYHQPHIMNGMNGANMGAVMPAPTPAGHQAELNYIYGMVEELSRQLADNRKVTEDIVSGLGKVRNKARTRGLGNDDVIAGAADDINGKLSTAQGLRWTLLLRPSPCALLYHLLISCQPP